MLVAVATQARTPQREASSSVTPLHSPTRSTRKKKSRKYKEDRGHTKCICGNPKCDETMARLYILGHTEYGYFCVPAKPKPSNSKVAIRKKQKDARHVQTKRRERTLAALPSHARTRANDESYSSKNQLRYASIHVHPRLLDLCTIDKSNHRRLPNSIPHSVGIELTRNTKCTFTQADLVPYGENGEYFPIPNYPPSDAFADAITLEEKTGTSRFNDFEPIVSPPATRSGAFTQRVEIAQMKRELDDRMEVIKHMEQKLQNKENDLILREKEMQRKLEEVSKLIHSHGLSRFTITSRSWHKKNKYAATTLFGFTSWKETVMYLHALFGLYPPMGSPSLGSSVSAFEWCLLAKMRMNCAMLYRTLSFILRLKSPAYVGKRIKLWVYEWGEAGEDISILDVTKEFLEKTCPQAFKDEGLEKVCAIPNGKDFKMYTPRKNTLCLSARTHVSLSDIRYRSWD